MGTTIRRHATPVLLAVVAGTVPVAAADGAQPDWRLGTGAGIVRFHDAVTSDPGTVVAFRGAVGFGDRRFELEALLFHGAGEDDRGIESALGGAFLDGVVAIRPRRRLQPTLALGLGWVDLERSVGRNSVSDRSLALRGALGLRLELGAAREWRLEIELAAVGEETFDQGSTHATAVIGVSRLIGRRRTPAGVP